MIRGAGSWSTMVKVAAASIASMVVALDSAHAMTCDRWRRIAADDKVPTVERMIDDALASNRGRRYEVNRDAVARCLRDRASEIATAFDDVCSNSRTASKQAIRDTFDTYVWSCVG